MITIETIKELVEKHFKIPLIQNSREREYLYPRKIYFNLCKWNTKSSGMRIAKLIDKDHATFLHHVKNFEDTVLADELYRNEYLKLLNLIDSDKNLSNPIELENSLKNMNQQNVMLKQKLNELNTEIEENKTINKLASKFNESQAREFIKYRMIPFMKMHKIL